MSASTTFVTTTLAGGSIGTRFDDVPPSGDLSTSTISKIVLNTSDFFVYSIAVWYSWNDGTVILHGHDTSNKEYVIDIEPDEFITRIKGWSRSDGWITGLVLVTTKRSLGPYGADGGTEPFVWGSGSSSDSRLVAFSGHADAWLRGLQATFAEHSPPPKHFDSSSKTARYEVLSIQADHTNHTPAETRTSRPLSKFSRHLMSAIATLHVGAERVQFHVHEDTLCKLSFFQAALHGKFKEASEKTISMPEDDPNYISALTEFLSTGNYTYPYDARSVQPPKGSDTPVGDLTEGLFHLGVYMVASKYDCPGLSEIALGNFECVANELDDLSTLRLWEAAYGDGLRLSRDRERYKLYHSGEGLVAWVRALYKAQDEEMDGTMVTCSQLASDLLRIATSE